MKFVMLDGSPKAKGSTSLHLLKAVEERLPEGHTFVWRDARSADAGMFADGIAASDALVVAFPLYVDSIPSHLLRLLEAMQPLLAAKAQAPIVYSIVNCGFFDARQNHIALAMMRLWSEKSGLAWGGGLAIGAGGMAQSALIGYGPLGSIGKSLDAFAHDMLTGETKPDIYGEPNFPRFFHKTMAHIGWRVMARKNGVPFSQIKRRLPIES